MIHDVSGNHSGGILGAADIIFAVVTLLARQPPCAICSSLQCCVVLTARSGTE
jgi:hypothetical protein